MSTAWILRESVQAEQFDGLHADDLLALLGDGVQALDIILHNDGPTSSLRIVWRGQALDVSPGDWLLMTGAGNAAVMGDPAFRATYQLAAHGQTITR